MPVTFKPFEVALDYGSRHYAHPNIYIRDTMLLAPGGMQSLKQVATMTHFDKLDLSGNEIAHMDRLLADAPERFAEYAINDVRVALEYYLRVMADFEALFECDAQPMTLGDAAVKAYLNRLEHHTDLSHEIVFGYEPYEIRNNKGHKDVKKGTKTSRRYTETMATDAYIGGMNVAYRIGPYHDPDKLILDIDFAGAYVAALATLPLLDWDAPVASVTTTQLPELYQLNMAVPITLVECRFKFPNDCEYPCLPIPSPYGPIYPLNGATTCTGLEVAQALLMRAEIEMIRDEWFPTLTKGTDGEQLAFAEFLQTVTQKRAREPKGSLRNLMLKEIVNSFYGKQAQGLKERRIYNLQGQPKRLEPSLITCPHYAAMTTGIVRASLIAIVTEVAKHDGCETLSATTDGCMIAVPRSLLNFDIQHDESGRLILPTSAKEAIPTLYNAFMQHYPIQVLEQGRRNMHLPADTWLEIKHGGDMAQTYKTRGYHLTYQGITQHIARAGLKLEYDGQLNELYNCDDIPKLGFKRLASMRMIMEGEVEDLVDVPEERTVNLDYDFKRIPLPNGSGKTRPPQMVQEVTAARDAVDRLRKQGLRATPDAVAIALTGIQMRGGTQATIRRYIRRAVMHDVGYWRPYGQQDSEIARRIGVSVDALRQDKRREFYPQTLPPTSEVLSIIQEEAQKLGIHLTRTRLEAVVGPIDNIPAAEEMARELSRAIYEQFFALYQAGEKVWPEDIGRMLNESFERLPMQETLNDLCEAGLLEVSVTEVGDVHLVELVPGTLFEKEGLWREEKASVLIPSAPEDGERRP